ncbi:SusC/RagA family TonB-linked outer membrane protein [uncultured Olleya sp.]|uniref:SusC/RagA family TonB-linked outer membrane protein n=1 Tax=uncultured Olleya sp. TaxID=757243 RepID=UPI002593ABA8|nr:SusC/RagA family TonB-linked outer membrane protein [uncultured Olleya sp.]
MKTNLNRILTLFLITIASVAFAQERIISGTISDENGVPLPSATVIVKNTSTGTTSDFDGKYSIKASNGQILTFSYVGYGTIEQKVTSSNAINISLSPDNTLDEVVVTALGIKREEKALGYSVQSIKGEGMTEARESNITNAISGKVAGVQVTGTSGSVGSSSRIVLRGNSSITGNNEPLYVVDGVPIDNRSFGGAGSGGGVDLPNGAADINPDDIESVTVLKGPNAAALYGLRAGNGVIVITTKKGTNGKKFGVSINSNITFSNPLLLPNYQNSYGQGGSNYFEFVDGAGGGVNDGVDESWGAPLDVGLEFIQWNSQLNGGNPLPWRSYEDNVRDFLDTGLNISNNVSLTTDKVRLSIGNSEEKGMVPFTDLSKMTIGFNGTLDLGDKFTAGVSATYFNVDSNNLPISGYNNENPFQQFIWSARQVNFSDLRNWRNFPLANEGTAAEGTPLNWNHNFQNNPYWILETNTNTFEKDRLIGNIDLAYKFADWFTLSAKVGTDFYNQLETSRQAVGSNSAADGSYTEVQRRFEEINSSILLSFNDQINEDFAFSLNLGANQMERKYNSTFGNLPALELPNLYNLSNLQTGATAVLANTERNQEISSVYGYGQVSFKNFLFLDFTARNDWASILPSANNSFFYPSVSGSIVLSDALNIRSEALNFLKIRGGWSKVGSTGALSPYNLTPTFTLANSGFGNQASLPDTQFNPNLKAETVTGIEVGIDGKFFNNRIRLGATYYNQKSEDLLVPIQVSPSTGYASVWDNVADMTNKGYEIQLGFSVIKTEDLSFDVDLNWAKNENTVDSLGELDSYTLGGQWGLNLEARPGQPYGLLVGRDFERDNNGQVIYENGLPVIDQTYKVLGDIAPDWTGGANFTVKYKNFDFSALVDAKIGGEVHSMTYAWGRFAGTLEETLIGRETGIVGNGVMSDGNGGYTTNNVVVSAKVFNQATYSNSVESSSIFDASYVKLRQLTLGYSFSKKLLKNTPIQSLKLSLVGRNLAILYKKAPHIDPETGFSSSNGNQGQEFGQYPSARNIGFNVNLKF